ncbi:DUF7282 domain-containing protein [Natronobiforma cellulositropha]|uniref:DUF7282 domain-containing protein n=1 Tax=Natronobiforma cellulositropha TaxID=1679076 RepID=UPI0021D5E9AA|nr:CARDB domain-containing protein [Natronobiforma cellulositropha]
MNTRRGFGVALTVAVAVAVASSIVVLPLLGGAGAGGPSGVEAGDDERPESTAGTPAAASTAANGFTQVPLEPLASLGTVEADSTAHDAGAGSLTATQTDGVEAGVEEGIALVQAQGVEVSQEQRAAVLEAAEAGVAQHQEADVEQVQAAVQGSVHGALVAHQAVNVSQTQAVVVGATDGALSQYQQANATQLQSGAWGAAHGAVAQTQKQEVTVEQLQVATRGGAAGSVYEAGEKDVANVGKTQEAAQGAVYGVLEQYQKLTVEQRQRVTLEHVQHAAAGGAAGALEGVVLEGEQIVEVEAYQRVSIKGVQKAAMGGAGGALVQTQTVTVEQTQAAARGGAKGPLEGLGRLELAQLQRVSVTQIQEASFGAATGAITQSQEASVEQIQAAAVGAGGGVLVQYQQVTVSQTQSAALGAAKGAVTAAVQHQVVEVTQVQAAAFGAGHGTVVQMQVVTVVQVQALAEGAAGGALVAHQEATVEQIQYAASGASLATAKAVQYQRVSVTQLQVLAQSTAEDTTAHAVAEALEEPAEIETYADADAREKADEVDEREGEASLTFDEQVSAGETVVVESATLSAGGFVAIYEGVFASDPVESVRGVSAHLEPGDHESVEIDLDEPLEENATLVAVAHHDTTGDESFQYVEQDGAEDEPYVGEGGSPITASALVAVEDDPDDLEDPEPAPAEATLAVDDQTGDGTTLTVDEATASVGYTLVAEYDGERVESEGHEANESLENYTLDLEPPIEERTTVEVSLEAADDELGDDTDLDTETGADETDGVLANESIEYDLEAVAVDPELEYLNCTAVEVTGDVSQVRYTQAFYDPEGTGEVVSVPEIPWEEFADGENATLLRIGPETDAVERDDGTRVVQLEDVGVFGETDGGAQSVLTAVELEAEDGSLGEPVANPDAEACLEDVRPERPELSVEAALEREDGDGIDVTFGYENPNEAALVVPSEFVEGTVADGIEPPTTLEPGEGTFTVQWIPESEDERLVWVVGLEAHGYDEPAVAETDLAGEIAPLAAPAEFVIGDLETNAPVEAGETLEVTATVENVGEEDGTQALTLSLGDTVVDTDSLTLDPGESNVVSLSYQTGEADAGEYTATVSSANDSASVTVSITEPEIPDELPGDDPVPEEEPGEPGEVPEEEPGEPGEEDPGVPENAPGENEAGEPDAPADGGPDDPADGESDAPGGGPDEPADPAPDESPAGESDDPLPALGAVDAPLASV